MVKAANEAELREQICLIGQLMHQRQYVDGLGGNISARLEKDRILITPSGLAKGFMQPDQLIVVNMSGERVDIPTPANENLRPTSELVMHLACYQARDDIGGVVHAHPPTTVALTIAGYDFGQVVIPEMLIALGEIPTLPYFTPSSAESRSAIEGAICEHDALLLAFHGSLTAAGNVWDAYLRLESLEHTARILHTVQTLGGAKGGLSADDIDALRRLRKQIAARRKSQDNEN
jgi:L-fuculose-phosphate aldolase